MGDSHEIKQENTPARGPAAFGLIAMEAVCKRAHQSAKNNTADLTPRCTFHQVAEAEGSKQLMCPHCGIEANAIHVLWLCKETQKAFPPMDSEDKQEIEQGINLEF